MMMMIMMLMMHFRFDQFGCYYSFDVRMSLEDAQAEMAAKLWVDSHLFHL